MVTIMAHHTTRMSPPRDDNSTHFGDAGRDTGAGYGMAWPMAWQRSVKVTGAPVAMSGWVLTDRHDLAPCAVNSLHRENTSVSNMIGGTRTLGIA